MITIKNNRISVDDYNYLTEKVGWEIKDEHIVEEALNNTLHSVSIFDDDKIIGYGRIIGDKTMFIYLQNIIVIPEYQGKKIGTKIMYDLLAKIEEYKRINPNIKIYLGSYKGKEEFYKKFGFKTRNEAGLGESMILC